MEGLVAACGTQQGQSSSALVIQWQQCADLNNHILGFSIPARMEYA
jgi:hypothetical protein